MGSPRFLNATKIYESETIPTSVIDTKNSSNPFGYGKSREAIGLALIHFITEEKVDPRRMILLGPRRTPPADFGIKTRTFRLHPGATLAKNYVTSQLSLKEMKRSEEYTCVTIHGPNKKTTHIFDNCIVENCCPEPSDGFLSRCRTCDRRLELGRDIYMYMGERAFCSDECRFQEMLLEGTKNPEIDGSNF